MKTFRRCCILSRCLLATGLCWVCIGSFQLSRASDQSVTGNLDVSGELDVHGNSFSLGTWTDNPGNYGVIWTYAEDASHAATFTLTSSRSTSNWLWQKHVSGAGTGHVAQMGLSDGNALILYDLNASQNARIVLDPINTSSFYTSVVMYGNENEMPNQHATNDASVLTVGLADARYMVHNFDTAVTLGTNATANGNTSTAIGYGATGSGSSATAIGFNAVASGGGTIALGVGANTSGFGGTALGYIAKADGIASVSLGYYTHATADHSFAAGVGSFATGDSSTALGMNSLASGYASVSLGYGSVASGVGSSALAHLSQATNNFDTALGVWSVASGGSSNAIGVASVASADGAVSLGTHSAATTPAAEALGYHSAADGDGALAVGSFSHASGTYSTALSNSSVASGDYSVAAGRTEATSLYQFAVGAYGVLRNGDPNGWVDTDDLFTVGNGQSSTLRSDAFAVKKNGDTKVSGVLQAKTIIVPPQGDLLMGEFNAGPTPAP